MTYAVASIALLTAACGRRDDRTAQADSALNRDLTTAAQLDRAAVADTVATIERTGDVRHAAPTPVRRSTAARPRTARPVSSAEQTAGTASGTASGATSGASTAPAPRSVIVKHTTRDAAIGAAAGAIIGATTSRDKVKGGIIGGAAGAILGGVIGNNVDKKKTTVP